jgi:hypothetical protein
MSDCRRQLSPERRKIVLISAAVACMSSRSVLFHGHRMLRFAWLAVMVALLVYAIALLAKMKGQES